MDLKDKLEDIVKKIIENKDLRAKFDKNPAQVLESLLGVNLPDDQVNQVVAAVKAKIAADGIGSALGGLFGKK